MNKIIKDQDISQLSQTEQLLKQKILTPCESGTLDAAKLLLQKSCTGFELERAQLGKETTKAQEEFAMKQT